MNRAYIQRHNVIERYVADQLSSDEEEALEERLLWCEATQHDLEVVESLRSGIQALGPAVVDPAGTNRSTGQGAGSVSTTSSGSALAALWRLFERPAVAFASVAAITVVSTLALNNLLRDDLGGNSGLSQGGLSSALVFDSVRSEDVVAMQLDAASLGDPATFIVYALDDLASEFAVRVARELPASAPATTALWLEVWEGKVTGAEQATLVLSVPRELLQPGLHRIEILAAETAEDAAAGRYQPSGSSLFDILD